MHAAGRPRRRIDPRPGEPRPLILPDHVTAMETPHCREMQGAKPRIETLDLGQRVTLTVESLDARVAGWRRELEAKIPFRYHGRSPRLKVEFVSLRQAACPSCD